MAHTNISGLPAKPDDASRIIGIQFSILSPEEIRRMSVVHVTSRDTYINNKPVIGGLFDPRMGVLEPGLVCPTDGQGYMQTPGYFGHIELARPVFYVQYMTQVMKIMQCVCHKCSKLLINKDTYSHAMDLGPKKRWDLVYGLSKKVKFCGEGNCDGCGFKQPAKIRKSGIANLIAEWNDSTQTDDNTNTTVRISAEMAHRILRRISDDDINFMGFSAKWSRPEWMICQVLAVPPPAVRPSVKHDAQQRSEDDLTHIIINILKANKDLQDKIEKNAKDNVIEDLTLLLQYYIATMVNNKIPGVDTAAQRSGRALKSIFDRLNGKNGRVRGNLMGKRVDFSARSVITSDPNLSIRELGVPMKIAMNITFPEKVNARNQAYLTKLLRNGPDVYPGAKILERSTGESISLACVRESLDEIVLRNGDILHRHMLNGDPVLFNRQPTLHRMSMMCHRARIMKQGNTFRMNVADTAPYNADFDGDEMNMHMPQDEESAAELMYLAAVPRHIISPAKNTSIIGIFQDSMLSSFRFTRPNIKFTPRDAMNLMMYFKRVNPMLLKNKGEVSSFDIMSQILPRLSITSPNSQFDDDVESFSKSNNVIEIIAGHMKRGQIDKGVFSSGTKGLLASIFNDFGFQASSDFIDDLQNIVTEYMKISGYSVGISDLIADVNTNTKINDTIVSKKKEVKNIIDQVRTGVFNNNTGKTNRDAFEIQVNNLLNNARDEAGKIGKKSLDPSNRFVQMVEAGSKGSTLNIAQMISCLGQQNVEGKRIPYGFTDRTLPHFTKYDDTPEARGFVENSFIRGLTPQELFFHAMAGRVGLIDTAVKTSSTGYIQRRLIKGMEDLKVEYDMTVRNNMRKIIQFTYGEDGIDSTRTENQTLPLVDMSIEQVYAHFEFPVDDTQDAVYTTSYTSDALTRLKSQRQKSKTAMKALIDDMIQARDDVICKVHNYADICDIHVPVKFKRIINNVRHQCGIQDNAMVDITPLECVEMTTAAFERLRKIHSCPPTRLFEIMFKFYMSPRDLLMTHRYNKDALDVLLATITTQYKKSIIAPGEMVGMVAAQSIGEPTTQLTLNTFHSAGISSKTNVTQGVPRIEEVLSLSKEPKLPSVTVYLREQDQTNRMKAQQLMHVMEYTSLRDIVDEVSVCFDPNDRATLIREDREMLDEYYAFENMLEKEMVEDDTEPAESEPVQAGRKSKKPVKSKWIIRFVFNRKEMLDRNITMDDIHYAVETGYKDDVDCVFSDYNYDRLILRVRINDASSGKQRTIKDTHMKSLDQSDQIKLLNNIQDNLLDNIILKGVKNVKKVHMRKVLKHRVPDKSNYKSTDIWVLDTVGSNLLDILGMSGIDVTKTYSNNVMEMYDVLGIEAARESILTELREVLGASINAHHMGLLCDRMCASSKMVSIFRHGINNDNIGPIAKASFEETPEMFLRAAKFGEMDHMRGISAQVMTAQKGEYGTSACQIMLNMREMQKLNAKAIQRKQSIENALYGKTEEESKIDDMCNPAKIHIPNTVATGCGSRMSGKRNKPDTDYDLDF